MHCAVVADRTCAAVPAAFGTFVLAATDVVCKRNEQVIFNPKREVLVLVIITWVFQLLILCAAVRSSCLPFVKYLM